MDNWADASRHEWTDDSVSVLQDCPSVFVARCMTSELKIVFVGRMLEKIVYGATLNIIEP